jgi:hypothetical protein
MTQGVLGKEDKQNEEKNQLQAPKPQQGNNIEQKFQSHLQLQPPGVSSNLKNDDHENLSRSPNKLQQQMHSALEHITQSRPHDIASKLLNTAFKLVDVQDAYGIRRDNHERETLESVLEKDPISKYSLRYLNPSTESSYSHLEILMFLASTRIVLVRTFLCCCTLIFLVMWSSDPEWSFGVLPFLIAGQVMILVCIVVCFCVPVYILSKFLKWFLFVFGTLSVLLSMVSAIRQKKRSLFLVIRQ